MSSARRYAVGAAQISLLGGPGLVHVGVNTAGTLAAQLPARYAYAVTAAAEAAAATAPPATAG